MIFICNIQMINYPAFSADHYSKDISFIGDQSRLIATLFDFGPLETCSCLISHFLLLKNRWKLTLYQCKIVMPLSVVVTALLSARVA